MFVLADVEIPVARVSKVCQERMVEHAISKRGVSQRELWIDGRIQHDVEVVKLTIGRVDYVLVGRSEIPQWASP